MDESTVEKQPANDLRKNTPAEVALWCGVGTLSGFVIWALIIVIPFVCIAGAVFGMFGLYRAYRHPHRYSGRWQAWAGICLCIVMFFVVGKVFSALNNYAEPHRRSSELRETAVRIGTYAEQHQGNFPATINGLGIPPENLSYKRYYFYYLHTTHPYLYNENLAGKNAGDLMYPDRTLLLAPGKSEGASFRSLHDIDLHGCGFTFVDGHADYYSLPKREITKRFPPDGKVTDETWFIKPQMKGETGR